MNFVETPVIGIRYACNFVVTQFRIGAMSQTRRMVALIIDANQKICRIEALSSLSEQYCNVHSNHHSSTDVAGALGLILSSFCSYNSSQ